MKNNLDMQRDLNQQPFLIQTLNNLAKLAKRLSCVVSTYLYVPFDGMSWLCDTRILEWIYIL